MTRVREIGHVIEDWKAERTHYRAPTWYPSEKVEHVEQQELS